jgi:ABC-type sugar transport system ATPase subunit
MAEPTRDDAPLLSLQGLVKRFGGVTALKGVDFELRRGEIHALLGENGAGKSTLIKVLGGIHLPDAGSIHIDGQKVDIGGVADADRFGIRIIHQELSLAPNLSVAENIYLGRESHRFGFLNRKAMFSEAKALVQRLGLNELRSVHAEVADLSVAHQQLVEIARALSTEARILVLDEPTSSLSEAETESLFITLRQLRSQGVGIIYISHRLEEILRLADRITVLRDGESIGTQATSKVNQRELVHWMVGREIVDYFHRPAQQAGEVALKVADLCNDRIDHVSLELRYGEVLGIAGLVGSGRSELVRALFGMDSITGGSMEIDGRPVQIRSPRDALQAGLVLVPEDRKREGLVMLQSVAFNAAIPWVNDWIRWAMPNAKKRRAIVDRAVKNFNIKVSDSEQSIDGLSGGNQQKVLVGRWMEHRPKILILDEPTRGVDVGAREEMFTILSGLVESGMAVLLISSDLTEVLNMSHRVAVYRDGRILQTTPALELTLEHVMEKLTGATTDEIR